MKRADTTKRMKPRDDSWSRPAIWQNQNEVDEGASASRDCDVRYSQPQHTGLPGVAAEQGASHKDSFDGQGAVDSKYAGGNAHDAGHPGTGGTREERHHIAKELNFNHSQQLLDRTLSYNSPASKLESAMREVHNNIPRNVKKSGKTGKAREAMIRAIGFSKARAAGAKV